MNGDQRRRLKDHGRMATEGLFRPCFWVPRPALLLCFPCLRAKGMRSPQSMSRKGQGLCGSTSLPCSPFRALQWDATEQSAGISLGRPSGAPCWRPATRFPRFRLGRMATFRQP